MFAMHTRPAQRRIIGIIAIATALLFSLPAGAADEVENKPLKGFIDINGYYDTRDFSVMTVNLLANLPGRIQYFSLTNFSNSVGAEKPEDLDSYYTEQNLRWAPFTDLPVDIAMQWTHMSGTENDVLRLGPRWRLMDTAPIEPLLDRIGLVYVVSFYIGQFDDLPSKGTRMQIEHVYRIPILPSLLDNRVYLGGFIDHNIWSGAPTGVDTNTVVTEHQLGVRLFDRLYAVAEFRRNEFFPTDKNGVGFGLEYVVPFTRND